MKKGQKKIQNYCFNLKDTLGRGSYAMVFRGINTLNQQNVAIKVIPKIKIITKQQYKNICSQIKIMKNLYHPNILSLLDVYQTYNNLYIITQFCNGGDLARYIKSNKKINENQSFKIFKGIFHGLYYLNSKGIIHRDLKPANVLFKNGQVKIADFGFARSLQMGNQTIMQSMVGTPLYMSPQLLIRVPYTSKSDIWSIGFILYEMIFGITPWKGLNQEHLINMISSIPLIFPGPISKQLRELLIDCLKIKQEQRIDWQSLRQRIIIQPSVDNSELLCGLFR